VRKEDHRTPYERFYLSYVSYGRASGIAPGERPVNGDVEKEKHQKKTLTAERDLYIQFLLRKNGQLILKRDFRSSQPEGSLAKGRLL